MAFNSSIEWTESTWNPITGCTKVSPACSPQLSVSVENQNYTYRIDNLRYTHAIIVGGVTESKACPTCLTARQVKEEWVITIRDDCKKAGIPFFLNQWGGINKKKSSLFFEGRTWDELLVLRAG